MYATEELASERTRSHLEQARLRQGTRTLRMLHRAERKERKAERRLLQAWQHADRVRGTLEAGR